MKYLKPQLNLKDYLVDEKIAAFTGFNLSVFKDEVEFEGEDNEEWVG